MKKILIISYFFPPANIISANRTKSFAENFKKHGLYPTIVTRHWDGNENSWEDLERPNETSPNISEFENYKLIQLPYKDQWYGRFCRLLHKASAIKRFLHLVYNILGIFSPHQDTYGAFQYFLRKYLRDNEVDYILVTSSPTNIIKLGGVLSKEFKIPFIVDFRDLWEDKKKLLRVERNFTITDKIKYFIQEFHLKIWLNEASFITAVSQPLIDEVNRLIPGVRTTVVMNGYEKEVFNRFLDYPKTANPIFTFSTIGTLYPEQNLTILIDGLNLFLKDKDLSLIKLNFIGTAFIPKVAELLSENLPAECLTITGRVPREEAIEKTYESDVLFYAGWIGFRGIVSGKIFEYIAAQNRILIAPNDKDVIEEIITKTETGEFADSPQEFATILNKWFNEWKTKGKIEYTGNHEKIDFYSRENQAEIFADEILKIKA